MTWTSYYKETNSHLWEGRKDTSPRSCFFQIIQSLNLTQPISMQKTKKAFALLGFCCDEGIRRNLGRVGAAEGPDAIRKSLSNLPYPHPQISCYDSGNIICADENLESAQEALAEAVAVLLENNLVPIILGGGHEVAWGHYQGIAKKFSNQQLGIVNFDAHFDMRPLIGEHKGSSGTPFLQIANASPRFDYNCIGIQTASNTQELFKTAENFAVKFLYAEDLHFNNTDKCQQFIQRIQDQNQIIYVSLCLDVFASPYAPGTSAPQIFGLTPWQVLTLLRPLAASGKTISYDIAEMSPKYDIDQRTAKLAANLIYEIMRYHVMFDILRIKNDSAKK